MSTKQRTPTLAEWLAWEELRDVLVAEFERRWGVTLGPATVRAERWGNTTPNWFQRWYLGMRPKWVRLEEATLPNPHRPVTVRVVFYRNSAGNTCVGFGRVGATPLPWVDGGQWFTKEGWVSPSIPVSELCSEYGVPLRHDVPDRVVKVETVDDDGNYYDQEYFSWEVRK